MSIRTTSDLVKKIVKVKASHDLTPFIEAASQLVDDCCTTFSYSDDKLERIERWLAAHFYCIEYSRAVQTMAGGLQKTIQSKVDLYLSLTHYGQMAQMLDTSLGLAALNNNAEVVRRIKVSLTWLGKNCETTTGV